MHPEGLSRGNLLINGAFLPGLWTRLSGSQTDVVCPVDAETFAADRWRLRYAAPEGGPVSQERGTDLPPDAPAGTCVVIHGAHGVTQNVYFGQTIEADEALHHRQELRFSIRCRVEHPVLQECPVRLAVGHPMTRDVFDVSMERLGLGEAQVVPANAWTQLDFAVPATASRALGLCVELEFPAAFLADPQARVLLAAATLGSADGPTPGPRSSTLEALLARRFFQRHSAETVNAIGRALVCNPHELYFQFTFPEMRAFPAVTLPQDNDNLCVFSLDGVRQTGFVYDVAYRARGSAIIRATKSNHDLRDGHLAFRGYGGAILLDAEL
jgi:hypothetical protein